MAEIAASSRPGSISNNQRLQRESRSNTFRKKVLPWLFVLPILLINFVVIVGPSLGSIAASLTDWNGMTSANFIGLANFQRLLGDPEYKRAFTNNITWLLYFLTIPIGLALLAASLLAPIKRGGLFLRTALFIPYVLPSVINANIWRNLLSPTMGIGAQLSKLGIQGLDQAFLGNPKTSLIAVAFVDSWHYWGFLMVLFLSAMQNVAPDLYDAARVDGATRWQEFRHVTLPGIRPTVVFMLLMTSIWSFLVFDYIWILTQGGPAGSSEVLGTLVVKNAIARQDAGYAASIGLTMSFFALIVISLYLFLRRRGWEI
jgi:raffinose/stachyose/melibiose transport system permease protein